MRVKDTPQDTTLRSCFAPISMFSASLHNTAQHTRPGSTSNRTGHASLAIQMPFVLAPGGCCSCSQAAALPLPCRFTHVLLNLLPRGPLLHASTILLRSNQNPDTTITSTGAAGDCATLRTLHPCIWTGPSGRPVSTKKEQCRDHSNKLCPAHAPPYSSPGNINYARGLSGCSLILEPVVPTSALLPPPCCHVPMW